MSKSKIIPTTKTLVLTPRIHTPKHHKMRASHTPASTSKPRHSSNNIQGYVDTPVTIKKQHHRLPRTHPKSPEACNTPDSVLRKLQSVNRKPLIGMITVPLTPTKKFYNVCGDSYIATSHIAWLERHGVDVLPIPYTIKYPERIFKQINGIYLPSGGVFAGNSKAYYECCKKFVELAIKANDSGSYFPVWGGCMGFQQMLIIADGHDDLDHLLQLFDSYDNLMLPLEITPEGYKSRMLHKIAPACLKKLETEPCTMNNHKMGITPYKFKQHKGISDFYKIVSINHDRKGRPFVSTMEAYHYPFYGVQWHPERSREMDHFAAFFANELRKNNHRRKHNTVKMYGKDIDCYNYSGSIYKKCRFYWHKVTSKHHAGLCTNLNMKSIQDGNLGA